MKKLADVLMNAKVLIAFVALLIIGRLLLKNYQLPEEYLPFLSILKTIFIIVFALSALHMVAFFVFGFMTQKKDEEWFTELDQEKYTTVRGIITGIIADGMIYNLPVFMYCLVCYMAIYSKWWNIFLVVIVISVTQFLRYRENKKQLSEKTTTNN